MLLQTMCVTHTNRIEGWLEETGHRLFDALSGHHQVPVLFRVPALQVVGGGDVEGPIDHHDPAAVSFRVSEQIIDCVNVRAEL